MFIFTVTGKRANPDARYTDEQGTQYPQVPKELLTEIPDPVRGDDETCYNQEIDDAPYLIVTPKPPEMIEANRVAKIDAQILGLEKQAIEQGLIRTIIDDLLIRSLQIAAAGGVTEAMLLDPQDPHYSKAYEKVHANAAARAVLRAHR